MEDHRYGSRRSGGMRCQLPALALGIALALPSACAHPASDLVHTAFSAECNHQFDWFSVALFYSHGLSGQPGPITRLLACNPAELKSYRGLDIGPTFVHPNLREHPIVDEVGYPSYNKPGSLMFWLNSAQAPAETFLLFVDADMLIRRPLDPLAFGAARGMVVSAEYGYLVGTGTGFAARFIRSEHLHRQAQVGGFHILHAEDARRISPKWFQYTLAVRRFSREQPEVFAAESMHVSPAEAADPEVSKVRRNQGRWHSEMYGYVFAAAEEGLQHVVRRDVMLYPGYVPFLNAAPSILHYGTDYSVKARPVKGAEALRPPEGHGIDPLDFYFNKMSHVQYDLTACPSRLVVSEPPPMRYTPEGGGDPVLRSKRDLICLEHALVLIAAHCGYIRAHCPHAESWPEPCRRESAEQQQARVREVQAAMPLSCDDLDPQCAAWAERGECTANAGFMMSTCPQACRSCDGAPPELLYTDADRALGLWSEAGGAAPLLPEGAPLDAGHDVHSILAAAGLSLRAVGIQPRAEKAPDGGGAAAAGADTGRRQRGPVGREAPASEALPGGSEGTSSAHTVGGGDDGDPSQLRPGGPLRARRWAAVRAPLWAEALAFASEHSRVCVLLLVLFLLVVAAFCVAPRKRRRKGAPGGSWLLPTTMAGTASYKNV